MAEIAARILIVDDEVDNCANLSDIFCEFGYQVDTANDGLTALDLVRKKHYDIALLDLRMPGMNGLELYQQIKQISAGTVALIVTAYATSETAQAALAAGARRVISKPVDTAQLLELVREALESPLVLVVDDDSDLCDNLWEIFHQQGFRIQTAHDIEHASQALKLHQFQVVLIDMKLPDGDGHNVLALIKQNNSQARTIIITGQSHEMDSRIQKALAAGASAVAYKPFNVEKLLKTVTELSQPRRKE